MIYWSTLDEEGNAWLGRANNDGSSPQPQWISSADLIGEGEGSYFQNMGGLAVSVDHIYYSFSYSESDESEVGMATFYVGRLKPDGSAIEPLCAGFLIPEGSSFSEVAILGEHLFVFLNFEVESENKFFLGRANLDGSEPEPEWIELPTFVSALYATDSHLYFASQGGLIGRVKPDGTELESEWLTLESDADELFEYSLGSSGGTLFVLRGEWYEEEEKELYKIYEVNMETLAIEVVRVYLGSEEEPHGLAASESNIYVTEFEGIGRFVGHSLEAAWIALGTELSAQLIAISTGEEEEEGSTVKVKVGGELRDAKRYVKVGGELIQV